MPPPNQANPALTFRFGPYELDTEPAELRMHGEPVELQARVLELLVTLARRHPSCVSPEELLDQVWPDAVVSSAALRQAVRKARKAVGDDGERQAVIETRRGQGFRFRPEPTGDGRVAQPAPADAEASLLSHADIEPSVTEVHTGTPNFVGRGQELAALHRRVELAAQGRGSLVHIMGPAGIGKTALVERLPELCTSQNVYTALCIEEEGMPAFWPWIQLIEQITEELGPAVVRSTIGAAADELSRLVPSLRNSDYTAPMSPRSGEFGRSQERFVLLHAVVSAVVALSSARSFVLIIEDLQWADDASAATLALMARQIERSPLLVVATRRTEADGNGAARLPSVLRTSQPGLVALCLDGLSSSESHQLLREALDRPSHDAWRGAWVGGPQSDETERVAWSEDDLSALVERAEGNPLYLLELASSAAGVVADLPGGIREALERRLRDLDAKDRALLEAASAIGRQFPPSMLLPALQDDDDDLVIRIDGLIALGWIREVRGELDLMEFVHALHHEALYSSLAPMQRRQLHLRLLQLLETKPDPASRTHVSALAAHSFRAAPLCDLPEAIAYQVDLAERSTADGIYDEAAKAYGRTLKLIELRPESAGARRAELLYRKGQTETWLGHLNEASRTFDAAEQEALRHKDFELVARIALAARPERFLGDILTWGDRERRERLERALGVLPKEPSSLRGRLLAQLALSHGFTPGEGDGTSNVEGATRIAKQAVDMTTPLGNPIDLVVCRLALYLLQSRARSSELDELLELAEAGDDASMVAEVRVLRCAFFLAKGKPADLLAELDASRALFSEHPLFGSRLNLELFEAMLHGQLEEADTLIARHFALTDITGNPQLFHWAAFVLFLLRREQLRMPEVEGELRGGLHAFPNHLGLQISLVMFLIETDRLDEARVELARAAKHPVMWNPRELHWFNCVTLYAEFAARLGVTEGLSEIRPMLEQLSGRHIPFSCLSTSLGPVDYYLGMVHQALGDLELAVECFERGAASCRAMEAPLLAAHCDVGLAGVLVERNAADDAERAADLQQALLESAAQNAWPRIAKLVWNQRLGREQK